MNCNVLMGVWLSDNVLVSIDEVTTLHQAQLVLRWVTVCGRVNYGYVIASNVNSVFYPLSDGKTSISFRYE